MRIESIRVGAFGPLRDAELDLAPGMTVVVGENESAKTSWHAALFAGLCGIGRRQGRDPKPVSDFVARHRPWDNPDQWEVTVVVALDDGRRVEIRQDLANRTNCRAVDLVVGRDAIGEILREQVPDGASWVGLDRQSFPATACVRQADLLGVLDHSDALQTHLQRAASTSGVRGTAAEALDLLESFLAQQVGGTDQRSRSRPLLRATEAVEQARTTLAQAQQSHADHLQAVAELDRLRSAATAAEGEVRLREAALAFNLANDLAELAREAAELAVEFPDGKPVGADADRRLGEVTAALEAWESREVPGALDGPSADELRSTLAALPPAPDGDILVHSSVEEADRALHAATFALDQELRAEPVPLSSERPDLDADELLDLAHRVTPVTNGALGAVEADVKKIDADLARSRQQSSRASVAAVVAAVSVIAGLLGGLAGPRAILSLAVLGVLGLVAALVMRGRAGLPAATAKRQELEGRLRALQDSAAQREATRRAAAERCDVLNVVADPVELRTLAEQLRQRDTYGTSRRQWQERVKHCRRTVQDAEQNLEIVLRSRGVRPEPGLASALAEYRRGCAERAHQAEVASQRVAVANQLAARVEAERLVAEQLTKNSAASARVCHLARELGCGDVDAPAAATALNTWLIAQHASRGELDQRIARWSRLEHLLAGRSLNDIHEEAQKAAESATRAAVGLDLERIRVLATTGDPGAELPRLRASAAEAADAAGRATETLGLRMVPSVPGAEEALARTQAELDRVQRLWTTLRHTIDFLKAADDRVGRQLAPVLGAAVTEWLPRVTNGRYVDALVTPDSLDVKVRGHAGAWREAKLLSQGTSEQIFLLLRVALVRYLTEGKDTCPLILDDVTVQADASRTVAILELLHGLSADQQIILFAQEQAVADWASDALSEPADRLVKLEVIAHT